MTISFWKKTLLTTAAVSVVLTSTNPFLPAAAMEAGDTPIQPLTSVDYDKAFLHSLVSRIRQNPADIDRLVTDAKMERPHLSQQIISIYTFHLDYLANTPPRQVASQDELVQEPAPSVVADNGEEEDEDDDAMLLVWGGLGMAAIGGGIIALMGGGGGSSRSDDKTDRPEPEKPSDEYLRSGGLEQIQAKAAYDRGHAGQGVIVGLLDDGFDLEHPELAGKFISPYHAATDSENIHKLNHGTHVAGIIGANKDGKEMHGVAWDAKMIPIAVGDSNGRLAPIGKGQWIKAAWDHAISNGADIINNSWGIRDLHAGSMSGALFERDYADIVEAARSIADADAISVFSTGNDRKEQPSFLAALPGEFSELEGHWVAVTSVDSSGELAIYANACGDAADWCLAAPGNAIYASSAEGFASYTGTSAATPHVSGSIAVLKSAFPYLSSPEILDILFETADELGDKAIYGHGLVNLERATRPVGTMAIPSGATVEGSAHALTKTSLRTAPAFGDGLAMALQGEGVLALDRFNRGYQMDMGNLVSSATQKSRGDYLRLMKLFGGHEERSRSQIGAGPFSITSSAGLVTSGPLTGKSGYSRVSFKFTGETYDVELAFNPDASRSFGLRDLGFGQAPMIAGDAFDQPHLSMIETGYGSALGFNLSPQSALRMGFYTGNLESERDHDLADAPKIAGAIGEFRTHLAAGALVNLSIGAVHEEGSLLGSVSNGAFGESLSSNTLFANAGAVLDVGQNARLTLNASLGRTDFSQDGLIRGGNNIITSSFGVGLSQHDLFQEGDALSLAVSQPLRVEGGSLSMEVPTLRGADGGIGYRKMSFTPEPSAREIDLQASYGFDLLDGVAASVGAMHRINPGHSSKQASETIGLMTVSFSF